MGQEEIMYGRQREGLAMQQVKLSVNVTSAVSSEPHLDARLECYTLNKVPDLHLSRV